MSARPAIFRARGRARRLPPVSVFRWDLDKTYLRSEFERVRDLVRIPFEKAADKVEIPGVPELLRAIRETARRRERTALVFFISASPPQIGKAIREKFALDGVEIDGIVFKDQLQILMRGKLRGLREQVGFKLTELLRGRLDMPADAAEYLFGDDWESDPLIYTLYAGLLDKKLDGEGLGRILDEIPVDRAWRAEIDSLLAKVPLADGVRRIFIHLERETPPARLRPFGWKVVPVFNPFQTAVCLCEEGEVDVQGIAVVAERLLSAAGYTREMLENSLDDIARRGHLGERARLRIGRALRRRGILPERRVPLRTWLRAMLRRSTGAAAATPDYTSILGSWRELR
ncbi:MAG: hypothetical protein ACREQJ_07950 [Candidatus Binatia bacterium]